MEVFALHLLAKFFCNMLNQANAEHERGISQQNI